MLLTRIDQFFLKKGQYGSTRIVPDSNLFKMAEIEKNKACGANIEKTRAFRGHLYEILERI